MKYLGVYCQSRTPKQRNLIQPISLIAETTNDFEVKIHTNVISYEQIIPIL